MKNLNSKEQESYKAWSDEEWNKGYGSRYKNLLSTSVGCQIDKVLLFQLQNNNTTTSPMVRIFPTRDVLKNSFLKHLNLHHAINKDNLWVFVILPNGEKGWYARGTEGNKVVLKKYGSPIQAYVNSEWLRVDMMDENERIDMIIGERE